MPAAAGVTFLRELGDSAHRTVPMRLRAADHHGARPSIC
jgi:hypothetical protein